MKLPWARRREPPPESVVVTGPAYTCEHGVGLLADCPECEARMSATYAPTDDAPPPAEPSRLIEPEFLEAPMTEPSTDIRWQDAETDTRLTRPPEHAADGAEEAQPLSTRERICPTCGHELPPPTTNELLIESLGLIGDQGDAVMVKFYTLVATRHPELLPMFPPDLVTAMTGDSESPGAHQREQLLTGIAQAAQNYAPESMGFFYRLAEIAGRHHAWFARPDGPPRGATYREYKAIERALFDTLHEVAGDKWRPEYDDAWSEMYDELADAMLDAAAVLRFQHPDTEPRYPRQPKAAQEGRD